MSTILNVSMKHKTSVNKLERKEERDFYLCISPWIIGFIVFTIGPIIASFILSFYNWDLVGSAKWIGLDNYIRIFSEDELFLKSLINTAYYSFVSVPLGMIGSLILALLMNQKLKGITIFRTIFYLPSVVSGIAVALLWQWIFNPSFGLINYLLSFVGIQGPQWLFSETWAMPALILMSLWGIGGGMIIYLAGLQGVPEEFYEAAEIDGATAWSRFWKITLPMLSPVIFFNLITSLIGSFQIFTQSYVMTAGGPNNATLTYVLYLFRRAFQEYRMGYASALAWIFFLVILVLTLIQFKLSDYWVYDEGAGKER